MTLENAAWAYGAVASLMFFGPFLADVMDMAVARERFSRQLLGACVWPIQLLWWARPSWLWREPTADSLAARLKTAERERDEWRAEAERLSAERGGFR